MKEKDRKKQVANNFAINILIVLPSVLVSSLRLRLYILPAGIEQKIGKSKDFDYNIDNDSVVYDSNKI